MKLKIWILQLLVKPIGNLLMGLVSAAVAAFAAWLAGLNADLAAQIDQKAVAAFVWGLMMWWLNGWINARLIEGPKAIQERINDYHGKDLAEDGIILPDGETSRELERLTGLPVRRATKP